MNTYNQSTLNTLDPSLIAVPTLNSGSVMSSSSSSSRSSKIQVTFDNKMGSDSDLSSFVTTSPETECFYLEKRCENLKNEISSYKQENIRLKNECDLLRTKLRDSKSDADFVDVNSFVISEKLESYLIAVNELLTDKSKLGASLDYLVRGIWSLIAFEYNSKTVESVKKVVDGLLLNIKKFESNEVYINSATETKSTLSIQSPNPELISITNELISHSQNAQNIKDKIQKQNEMLKELINELNKENTPEVRDNQDDADEYFSPGSSPNSSSLFMSKLKGFFKKQHLHKDDCKNKVKTSDFIVTDKSESLMDSIHSNQDIPCTSSQDINGISKRDCFYYNLNGFIAVDNSIENSTKALSKFDIDNRNESLATLVASPIDRKPETYYCPKCKTSVNKSNITLEKFNHHYMNCDLHVNLVCMFCLDLFDRSMEADYLKHVNTHLGYRDVY